MRGGGSVEFTSLPQRDAQIIVGFRVVGFKLERVAVGEHGILELTSLPQGIAQVIVGFRIVGFKLERIAVGGCGVVELALIS